MQAGDTTLSLCKPVVLSIWIKAPPQSHDIFLEEKKTINFQKSNLNLTLCCTLRIMFLFARIFLTRYLQSLTHHI